MPSIEEKRKQRFLFLKHLYEASDGSKFKRAIMWDIGTALGFSREETQSICEYLAGEGLLEYAHLGGGIAITHYGVVEIENAIAHPAEPTRYFPAVNIIHVQSMHQSQIQQGTISSTQTATFSLDSTAIEEFVSLLKSSISSLPLNDVAQTEANAEIATIDAQLASPNPKQNIISESLKSLRTILEGVAANAVAQQLISQISAMGI